MVRSTCVLSFVVVFATACAESPESSTNSDSPPQGASQSSTADDIAAVKAAVDAHWRAIASGDTAAIANQHTSDMTFFGPESAHLVTLSSDTPETAALWERFRGSTATWTPRDVQVQVFDDVAVAAFYNDGSVSYADGTTDTRTRRVTEVWVRQPDGMWKEAHHHDSPITT